MRNKATEKPPILANDLATALSHGSRRDYINETGSHQPTRRQTRHHGSLTKGPHQLHPWESSRRNHHAANGYRRIRGNPYRPPQPPRNSKTSRESTTTKDERQVEKQPPDGERTRTEYRETTTASTYGRTTLLRLPRR